MTEAMGDSIIAEEAPTMIEGRKLCYLGAEPERTSVPCAPEP